MPGSTRKWEMAALAGILLLAAFFRFWQLPEIPPGLYPDEAVNGNNALEALRTGQFKLFYPENNGREGLFINLQAIAIGLFGAEPWALRLVSAIFGTLTVLGIYLLTKEFMTAQSGRMAPLTALDRRVKTQGASPEANAPSAGMVSEWSEDERGGRGSSKSTPGILNVREGAMLPLLSAFFLATSYWHISFSRIGFRAILVPFFAVFGTYWLLRAIRTEKISSTLAAGIAVGLGFHTYIAFRFMPFVLAVPTTTALWRWYKRGANRRMHAHNAHRQNSQHSRGTSASFASPCTPCVVALFLLVTLVAALHIGLHFLQNPSDFLGRGGQVSIFSAESPAKEFLKSTALTLGMFNVRGDCNSRHNLDCQPQLFWPVGILFVVGFLLVVRDAIRKTLKATSPDARRFAGGERPVSGHGSPQSGESGEPWRAPKSSLGILGRFSGAPTELLLLAWFFFMMLPATLTREGLPHALRAIGLIPPAMIFAGLGGVWLLRALASRLHGTRNALAAAGVLFLIWIPLHTYRAYFIRFAHATAARDAFAADLWDQGQYLAGLPDDVQKFVMVNLSGEDIRGVPAPAQTVMFAADTFDEARRRERNIRYVTRLEDIAIDETRRVAIIPLNPRDEPLIAALRQRFPMLRARVLGGVTAFEN